jgi:hypothetical protein
MSFDDIGFTSLQNHPFLHANSVENKVAANLRESVERRTTNNSGVKYDSGKTRTGLMFTGFASALNRVAEVTTFGANKYTANGWVSVPSASERYTDAMYRHLLAGVNEKLDTESGLEHLAHAAWNILAILELQLRKELFTTDPTK